MLVWPFNLFVQNFDTVAFFSGTALYIFFEKLPGNLVKINFIQPPISNVVLADILNLNNLLNAHPIDSLPEASTTISDAVAALTSIDPISAASLKTTVSPLNDKVSSDTWDLAQTLLLNLNTTNPDKQIIINNLNNLKTALQNDPYQGASVTNIYNLKPSVIQDLDSGRAINQSFLASLLNISYEHITFSLIVDDNLNAYNNYCAYDSLNDYQRQTMSNEAKTTIKNSINTLYLNIQSKLNAINAAKSTIDTALAKLNRSNYLSNATIAKLQKILPQIVFYGDPALADPANKLYSDLSLNISSNIYLNILAAQLFSICIALLFRLIPIVRDMIQAFTTYDFKQIFYIFWYNVLIESIIMLVFYIIVLNALNLMKYIFNVVANVSGLNNVSSSSYILYTIQLLAAFGLSKWVENISCDWSPQAFIAFYFHGNA